MATAGLPEDGEVQLGPVWLPAGRPVEAWEAPGEPVAWVTRQPVPAPGPTWLALSALHAETGLVPVVLADDGGQDGFCLPARLADVDRLDAARLLAARWDDCLQDEDGGWMTPGETPLAGPGTAAGEPAPRPFPGLAPSSDSTPDATAQQAALDSLPAARIGLVRARRPSDVLPVVGWSTFDDPAYEDGIRNAVWIAAVLRSWEDRFGATLLSIGPGAEIRLFVRRPPGTPEAADRIAVEHAVFATECAGQGLREVSRISVALLNAPIWTFWWD